MGCVYCFQVGSDSCFKVGRTKGAPDKRLKNVAVGSPQKLTLHREVTTDDPIFLEKYVHWLLDSRRAPNGEFFNVSAEELDRAISEAESFLAERTPVVQETTKLQKRRPTNQILDATEATRSLHRELRDALRQTFLLEQRIELLQGQLQLQIGENLGIRGVASWKWREQWKLDQGALKREEPRMFDRFKRLSATRVFRVE